MTNDEMTSKNYDLLMNQLCPWGSLDVWHMIKHAEDCNINMYELAEILQDGADEMGVNLYDNHTDVNAILNDYILREARNDIENLINIDLCDYDVYYFANYLDCPLQYPSEIVEELENAIKENELTQDDFNSYSLYVLDEMGVNIGE